MRAAIALAALLALPAMADDMPVGSQDLDLDVNVRNHEEAYYQRTHTKPPVAGDFVIGPSLHYSMQLSPGLAFGYTWKKAGITLLGDASVLRLDAQDGEAPLRVGCRDFLVPYTTGAHSTGQFGVMVLFPIKDLAKRAP